MDITAWQLAWSVLIPIMLPNLRLGGTLLTRLEFQLLESRRKLSNSETFRTFRIWSMKLLQSWKPNKIWEGLSKMQLPGLCICRWHQHMQLARPAFRQKIWLRILQELDDLPFQYVESLKDCLQKWSYTNFVKLYTPTFLTIPDLRDGDKVNAMRKTAMSQQKMSWSLALDLLDLPRS